MILTSIGEQGVSVGDRFVKFRPSLLNMTRLGTPREIVEAFGDVCIPPVPTGLAWADTPRFKRWKAAQFRAACTVLWCCTDEPDISWLVGYINERGRYVAGALPLTDIVGLAMGLLRHGVMGDAKPEAAKRAKKSDYVSEFNAREFVSSAMAHLGTSEQDAWQMTMTSYIGAMRAKFPPEKDAKAPLDGEYYDHVRDWSQRVNRARVAKNV